METLGDRPGQQSLENIIMNNQLKVVFFFCYIAILP